MIRSRRPVRVNGYATVAEYIIRNAADFGPFFEDTVQPMLRAWAQKEAKLRMRRQTLGQIDTDAWERVIRKWCRVQKWPVPAPAALTQQALVLTRHFEQDWEAMVDLLVDEAYMRKLYPTARAKPVVPRGNPLEAPRWMSPAQARMFLALPGADARMLYLDQLRSFARRNPTDNPRIRKLRGGKRKPFQAQEILLERGPFTLVRAKKWLAKNGHKYGTITESEHFFHARQFPAADYQKGTLHNIALAKHVEAVVGIPKGASDAADKRGYDTRGPRQGRLFTARPGGPVGDVSEVLWNPASSEARSYGAAKGKGAHVALFEAWYTDEHGRRRSLGYRRSVSVARALAKRAHDELVAYAGVYGGIAGLRKETR